MKSPSKKPVLVSLKKRRERAEEIFRRLSAVTPEPHTELYFKTPFQLLVSVVLSAQTTDKSVNRCMQPLYDSGLTPETILELGDIQFLQKIRTIGLAPSKAKNVLRLSQIIRDDYQGQVPRTREQLLALPGVGPKTTSVILAELYGEPTLAVDTHVFRVTARLGLQAAPTPEKAEQSLLEVIQEKWRPHAHHWLILHGRYTCKALKPKCSACAISDLCPSYPLFRSLKTV